MMTKLVDNICHFLVNLLVHHRQLYDYLYDHRHIYIPELNLDLLDQLLVDLLHHLCHLRWQMFKKMGRQMTELVNPRFGND